LEILPLGIQNPKNVMFWLIPDKSSKTGESRLISLN
jgi:hypothetical protein